MFLGIPPPLSTTPSSRPVVLKTHQARQIPLRHVKGVYSWRKSKNGNAGSLVLEHPSMCGVVNFRVTEAFQRVHSDLDVQMSLR
ncbi:hypothetical protein TNIN_336531 [Trichonephila inaurata madagascariensis]|uniref:Uncharacterized protein n=1 Tax=Trichonephila inaurata madagascariensis TaxID=2747483 RepID=A0A8X6YAI2_9ARAC|nr:hypothetical protein TNIN_336531 [Trichonephila inaurata madagascariensis]